MRLTVLVCCLTLDVGAASAQEAPKKLRLVQDLRIGNADDPDLGFSRIGGVVVDAQSNVYVAELQSPQVRMFDSRGRLLRTIGRKGKGPGEFAYIDRIGLRGDTLWVSDISQGRITMFGREGKPVLTIPTVAPRFVEPATGVRLASRPTAMKRDGFVYWENPEAMVFTGMLKAPIDSLNAPIIRTNRDGTVVDTVKQIPMYIVEDNDNGSAPTPGSKSFRPPQTDMQLDAGPPSDAPLRLFIDDDMIVIDRRRAASSRPSTFTVTRTTAGGRVLYRRQINYNPVPYRKAFADTLLKDRNVRAPAFQAPVAGAIVGADGSLFLRRDADGVTSTRWMVLAPNGSVRGEVDVPTATRISWISATHIYAVERDADDVPWLVRYRIVQ